MNGTTLHSERLSWLGTNGWTEPGEKDAAMLFFDVLEAESAKIHAELYPPPKGS